MAQLIGFDKNRENVEIRGPCKLSINFMSEYLFVEPKNEAFKLISASFEWNFVMKKNLLFVFAEHSFQDFCLAFKNEQICKRTLDYINFRKDDTDTTIDGASVDNSFINPIFEAISVNPHINSDLIEAIAGWHQLLDESDKEKYSSSMKEFCIYDLIMTAVPTEHQQKKDITRKRKRKFAKIKKEIMPKKEFKNEILNNISGSFAKSIPPSQFQLFLSQSLQKLIIYESNQKESFHEYKFMPKNKGFKCLTCDQIAIIDIDEDGDFCVKLENDKHSCKLSTKIPTNYQNIKMIKKPGYQIFEDCAKYSTKVLVVLDSDDSNQCYEYFSKNSESKIYFCRCSKTKLLDKSTATICNEGASKEYVKIINDNHGCKSKTFEPEKYRQSYDYILKPYFEIQKFIRNGKESKRLVIYDSNDRSKFYRYCYNSKEKKYYCRGCIYKRKCVAATLNQNAEDEEYIILSNVKHVCDIKTDLSINNVVLRLPEIEVMEETKDGKPRVFLFEDGSRSKCYVFKEQGKSRYFCVGCRWKIEWNGKQKMQNTDFKIVRGNLLKEENGEYYFKMKPNQTHCCQPRPYQPEQYEVQNISNTFDFFYYRLKNETVKLAISSPDDNQLFFPFVYHKARNSFVCVGCQRKRKRYSIKLQKDADGKEYFNHDTKKHICEPIKASSIPKSGILKEHGIAFESKPKRNTKFDESKIVKRPNFELRPTKAGIPDKKLLILHPTDKTLCFEYFFDNTRKKFQCGKCHSRKRKFICAKLHVDDENGESYIVMGKNDHVCEPSKYQPL